MIHPSPSLLIASFLRLPSYIFPVLLVFFSAPFSCNQGEDTLRRRASDIGVAAEDAFFLCVLYIRGCGGFRADFFAETCAGAIFLIAGAKSRGGTARIVVFSTACAAPAFDVDDKYTGNNGRLWAAAYTAQILT